MSEGSFKDRVAGIFRPKTPATPVNQPITPERAEQKPGTIIGDVVIGEKDPTILSKDQFESSPKLLFHGAAREFNYSHLGEYDINETGADGSEDYGTGFYTTDQKPQAENYSVVRSRDNKEKPIVYSFLSKEAKMLDVRDKNNPDVNGLLPTKFVQEWLDYLGAYIADESNFANLSEFMKHVFRDGVKEDFLEPVKKATEEGKDVYIRGNYKTPGIFGHDKNGMIGQHFRNFMLSKGYDGMIYREGGEGEKAENLTGYVFYNYKAADTWDGWQKRK